MMFYSITIFISAFLLFQIQPLISRYILPWFGGTPAVWSTSMLFFQVVLLGGYAYAHLLALRWQPRKQSYTHLGMLLVISGIVIIYGLAWGSPLLPGANWKPPDSSHPIGRILLILIASVGLPYFILSTTGPLLQSWFRLSNPDLSPYRLYGLSNLGSLLGLVTYPVLVEPALTLKHQALLWFSGFLIFTLLCSYGAYKVRNIGEQMRNEEAEDLSMPSNLTPRPSTGISLLWISLAACASLMLLATTNLISQEITVIPFLWVLPLVLYLLSFILCFADQNWYRRGFFIYGLAITTVLLWVVLLQGQSFSIIGQIGAFSTLLFFVCMVCHGELYRLRPDPQHLTSFYLMISIGGAMGGIFVNFIAPWLFKGYWEFYLGLLACWLLILLIFTLDGEIKFQGKGRLRIPLMIAGIILLAAVSGMYIKVTNENSLESSRNFYGVLRVSEATEQLSGLSIITLTHGATIHGYQYANEGLRHLPTAYYHPGTGSDIAFSQYRGLKASNTGDGDLRVGVVGLGIATLVAYAEPGDYFRFYEINPDVTRLAEGDKGYFTYLVNSKSQYEVIDGDARISLENELKLRQTKNYDLLFVDAFSGGAVPVHLLTKEAFELYLAHIKPDGLLIFNVSNRHLDIQAVVQSQADHFGLSSVIIRTGMDKHEFPSNWMLLSANDKFFKLPTIESFVNQVGFSPRKPIKLWTDDYSNLFQILK